MNPASRNMLTKGSALQKPKAYIQLRSGIAEVGKGTCIFPISAGTMDDGVDMTPVIEHWQERE
jgi:hypothetical protein